MGKAPQEITQLSERWRIVKLDPLNCQLEELRTINGKVDGVPVDREQWCWVGFHGSLASALQSALRKQIVDEPGTVQHLIDRIDYWAQRFEAVVKGEPMPAEPEVAEQARLKPQRPQGKMKPRRRRTPT